MITHALTYHQALAIGQLARDQRPDKILVTNPQGVAEAALFVTFWAEDGTMVKHLVHRDGRVDSEIPIAA